MFNMIVGLKSQYYKSYASLYFLQKMFVFLQ